ncbi:MAG: MtrB/PioB family decaheme-associated outer membrane protein [Proteobacteria bacterium]|nr:MtrB/PioB family decaheme-associated outer membrane protein [Pseudomonadota bacterium]
MALALLAALGSARADDAEDVAKLTKQDSSASAGIGTASGSQRDRSLFGQYNGMREKGSYLLLDLDYAKRNDQTGYWTRMWGRNLGLDNREAGVSFEQQGNWRIDADYSELVRHDPRTINTGVTGIGTTTPRVNLIAPGAGTDTNLELKRTALGVNGKIWLTPSLLFEASFKNEDKDGSRLWGRGFTCTSSAAPLPTTAAQIGCAAAPNSQWALLMLPEPINSTTKQLEAKFNYSGERFTLVGGYYGSFYTNANGNMTPSVPGTLYNPLGVPTALGTPAGLTQANGLLGILQSPMALPPDNQAHQFSLSGNYAFTQSTRATFKYSYTHATQDRDFLAMGLANAPAGVSNLSGRMDSTLLQAGVTSRPMPKLSLLANLRIEDRKDKTPDALYNLEGVNRFANTQSNLYRLGAKVEGSYQLPKNFRATLGMDYNSSDRGAFGLPDSVGGVTALRQKNWETEYRGEIRRTMSENFSGALAFGHSRRDGSIWLKPNTLPATGVTPMADNQIFSRTAGFPALFTDRKRDKLRGIADWLPTEQLSVQFMVEGAHDRYMEPGTKGLTDGTARLYSLDMSWSMSENWKLTAYASRGKQTMEIDHSTGYLASLSNINNSLGVGINGKPSPKFSVGGNLAFINDRNIYKQGLDVGASGNATGLANLAFLPTFPGLPDVVFRQTRLTLFGEYALEKNAAVRVTLLHQQAKLNEWTWGNNGVPFIFSDGTTISLNQNQRVSYAGAQYIYKFQ